MGQAGIEEKLFRREQQMHLSFVTLHVLGFSLTRSLLAPITMFAGTVLCSLSETKKIHSGWISFLLKLKKRENEPQTSQGEAGNLGTFARRTNPRGWEAPPPSPHAHVAALPARS